MERDPKLMEQLSERFPTRFSPSDLAVMHAAMCLVWLIKSDLCSSCYVLLPACLSGTLSKEQRTWLMKHRQHDHDCESPTLSWLLRHSRAISAIDPEHRRCSSYLMYRHSCEPRYEHSAEVVDLAVFLLMNAGEGEDTA